MPAKRLPNSIRLVPKYADDWVTYELSEKHGWKQIEETTTEDLVQWTVPKLDVKISWFYDPYVTTRYYVIEGRDRKKIAKQIEAGDDILHPDEFQSFLDRFYGDVARRDGLFTIAAAVEVYDQTTFDIFTKYMQHEDALTRRSAVIAASETGWREFIAPITELQQDSDDKVRQDAEVALKELHEFHDLPVPDKKHITEGLTQLDAPKDIAEQLHVGLEGWAETIPIRERETVYLYDQLPAADASDEEIYATAKELSDAWTERIRASDHPLRKEGGVYCPLCHIAGIDLSKLGQPCPKCARELLRFDWTTF